MILRRDMYVKYVVRLLFLIAEFGQNDIFIWVRVGYDLISLGNSKGENVLRENYVYINILESHQH